MSKFFPMVSSCLLGVAVGETEDSKYDWYKCYAPIDRWNYTYERDIATRKNSERPLLVVGKKSGTPFPSMVVVAQKTPEKVVVYRDASVWLFGKDGNKELIRLIKSIFKVVEVQDRSKITVAYQSSSADYDGGFFEIHDII